MNESKRTNLSDAANQALQNPDRPIDHRQVVTSVRDVAAQSFTKPMFHKTKGEAIRTFTDLASHPDSMIAKHPEDFCLFEIGQFSEADGMLYPYETPVKIGMAFEFVQGQPTEGGQNPN